MAIKRRLRNEGMHVHKILRTRKIPFIPLIRVPQERMLAFFNVHVGWKDRDRVQSPVLILALQLNIKAGTFVSGQLLQGIAKYIVVCALSRLKKIEQRTIFLC